MTYSQKVRQVKAALRAFKRHYRQADSLGEVLERELARLIARKTLVEPTQLRRVLDQVQRYTAAAAALVQLVRDLVVVATA